MSAVPPVEWVRQFLRYEPETGKLYWLPRPRELCADERSFQIYKAVNEGKEALTADNGTGYRCGIIKGRKFKAHRVAWALHYGEWPAGLIDHINHDRSDNRIENLRDVDDQGNARNQKLRHDNSSGRVGVSFHHFSGLWQAQWRDNGRKVARYFRSFDEAAEARSAFENCAGYHPNHGVVA